MPAVSPATVVRAQFDAYNAHDVDAFLSYYAPDAVIVEPDGQVTEQGHDALRDTFTDLFARMPQLRAEYRAEISVGQWVAIHSVVPNWTMADGSVEQREWIEVYRVADGKITQLRLYR
ncbi:MAG: nuclear transport factor 2 family protein [Chloroflexota bacterium]|nr:nuclear transport factor 2 family protein [Chloroflexota bacterium]